MTNTNHTQSTPHAPTLPTTGRPFFLSYDEIQAIQEIDTMGIEFASIEARMKLEALAFVLADEVLRFTQHCDITPAGMLLNPTILMPVFVPIDDEVFLLKEGEVEE